MTPRYCAVPPTPERTFPGMRADRVRAILETSAKWVNGTLLHYYFFDRDTDRSEVVLSNGKKESRTWVASKDQQDVVREAFKKWKALGIGLDFVEVASRENAEARIGFLQGDGSWSYIGRDILQHAPNERTMNFGWSLTSTGGMDTALHEIGHTIGLPHEHQNPFAGIVWNEEAVYAALAQPPNGWDRQTTFFNILRKISPDEVQGSSWDPDSVMEYPFEPGLVTAPAPYDTKGIQPAGGLSSRDTQWVRRFYPAESPHAVAELKPFVSTDLNVDVGAQREFSIVPQATRDYEMRTFGPSDTVIVLFQDDAGTLT